MHMKRKLIKLFDGHYIGVDDSEIKEGDWIAYTKLKHFVPVQYLGGDLIGSEKKITHSSKSLSDVPHYAEYGMLNVQQVEKVIYGYSVEDRMIVAAQQYALDNCGDNISALTKVKSAWENGFKAHQELSKDKLFTTEHIKRAIELTKFYTNDYIIQLLLPKTEWDVEIDDNGAITLL